MNIPCIQCKGRNPANCGRTFCPITAKSEALFKVAEKNVGESFSGSSPSVFVGRFGYPSVNVGFLTPPDVSEGAWLYDAPRHWAKEGYGLKDVIGYRSGLVNSRFNTDVRKREKMLGMSQEVGMASKPVEMEIGLKWKPKFRLNTSSVMAPTGPNAALEKAELTSNPKISSKVEKVYSDIDWKANSAMNYLYDKGFDENFLSRILSVGTVGVKMQRKLVPTRWSITAVDDNIGKSLISEIKDFPEYDHAAYFGSYLGNYYLVMMFPEVWSYELFETYMPRVSWNQSDSVEFMTDYEHYGGRKDYASNTVGGYYAARLPILERLKAEKRQASVLCLRFITGEYACPLGVWVVREATRKAMESKPIFFASKELMLSYARALVRKKFNYNLDLILNESKLLKSLKQQKKLAEFL